MAAMPKPSTLMRATSASSMSANATRPTVTARTRPENPYSMMRPATCIGPTSIEIVTACAALSPAEVRRLIRWTAITPKTKVASAKLTVSQRNRALGASGAAPSAAGSSPRVMRECFGTNNRWIGRQMKRCMPA